MISIKSEELAVKIPQYCSIYSLLSQLYQNPTVCLLTNSAKEKCEMDIHVKKHSRDLDITGNLILVARES